MMHLDRHSARSRQAAGRVSGLGTRDALTSISIPAESGARFSIPLAAGVALALVSQSFPHTGLKRCGVKRPDGQPEL
jgi:hypothetical protein